MLAKNHVVHMSWYPTSKTVMLWRLIKNVFNYTPCGPIWQMFLPIMNKSGNENWNQQHIADAGKKFYKMTHFT